MAGHSADPLVADPVVAVKHLADRGGASVFEIGCHPDRGWYAWAQYDTKRIAVEGHSTVVAAAYELAERLLFKAVCRCTKVVALLGDNTDDRCRWRLMGDRWVPGCNVAPLTVAARGDLGATVEALAARIVEVHGPVHAPVDIDTTRSDDGP